MLTFYGIGMILGAGIYSIIGKAAGPANDSLWISFLIAAIVAALTALSYAELSTMYPKAGAEYVYLTKAFPQHKMIGSTGGLAVAFSGAATAATVGIAFAGYLGQFVEIPTAIVASTLLILLTGLAIIGTRVSAWTNLIFTLIEVSGLGLIIYLGFQSEKFGDALSAMPHLGTLSGAALVAFSFFGFENIVNLSEEANDPKRNIPRAILLSLAISSVLYILVSLAALSLVDPEQLAQSDAPLTLAAQTVSKRFGVMLGVVALFATTNTALLSMIGASRILFGMGKTKSLPVVLAYVLPSRKTPGISSLVILAIALMLLPLGKIEVVAGISSLMTMFAFCSVNVALIVLRMTEPSLTRSFRVPFSIGKVPILPLLGAVCSLVFMTQFNLFVYLVSGAFFAAGILLFLWRNKKSR